MKLEPTREQLEAVRDELMSSVVYGGDKWVVAAEDVWRLVAAQVAPMVLEAAAREAEESALDEAGEGLVRHAQGANRAAQRIREMAKGE